MRILFTSRTSSLAIRYPWTLFWQSPKQVHRSTSTSIPGVDHRIRRTFSSTSLPRLAHTIERSMQSQTEEPSETGYGNFKLLQSFPISYAPVKVQKWRSEKTGLTVVLGSHDAPITNGHFVIASEIFDDSGRPHTLEHLIFLGSKSYPYKGVLDQLANRSGSDGTNAWTADDHTAYTIGTAGSAGFLKMLPIYVDHILHPTNRDSAFVTEVHHITGTGEDAGVVYSEMQARENQTGDLMNLELRRQLYSTHSAYRSETGGLMANLRVLTAQQIRDYHAKYYVPYNLCLIIDGSVPLDQLFDVLNDEVEPLILSNLSPDDILPPSDWKRPFIATSTSEKPDIKKSKTTMIEFMEEDESMGDVTAVWFGFEPTDYRSNLAIDLLTSYLTYSATSPLSKEYIEIPKPYCTSIGFYSADRVTKNEIQLWISDVPTKHLDSIAEKVKASIKAIVDRKQLDMERMAMMIRRSRRKVLKSMESGVSNVLANVVIGDFLYGDFEGKELPTAFHDLEDHAALESWTATHWLKLLKDTFVDQPCITVIGKPSAALSKRIESEEKERIIKRKEEYGEEKLKELEKLLEEAKAESDKPPPDEMISGFPLTDPDTLTWIPVETAINNVSGQKVGTDQGEVQRHVDHTKSKGLAYQTHFAHVKSNFIVVTALFDTKNVPSDLKPYLSILQAALLSLPVRRSDGTTLTHEEVVDQLNDFTVGKGLTIEPTEYEKAISWLRDLVAGAQFTKERLDVIVAKQLQELPALKREGDDVARAWINKITYDLDKSASEAAGLLHSLEFIPKIAALLESEPDTVIKKLEEARAYLLDPEITRLSVCGDILSLADPKSALERSFLPCKTPKSLSSLSTSADTLTSLGRDPAKKCIVVPMASIEGSYSIHYAKSPQGYDHPDVAALQLSASVLNATESYLWKSIRGAGLAYGARIEVDMESGLCGFSVYRSPNAMQAYEVAGRLLRDLVDGKIELEQSIVDGARASLTYSLASKSRTVGGAASNAYLNEVLKGIGKDSDKMLLRKLPSITLSEIRNIISKYFLPIFSSDTAIGAVTVAVGKAHEVEEGFKRLGFEVERKELPTLGGEESESGDEDESMDGESEEVASEVHSRL